MKRPLIALGLIGFFIVVCFLTPPEIVQTLRLKGLELIGPVLRLTDGPTTYLRDYNKKLETLDHAQSEAERLRRENANLQLQVQLLQDKKAENDHLREMLGYKAASPYRLRPCHVIGREPSSWWETVKIDIGWADDPDLAKDQPVVTPRGVVGKTGAVSKYTTDVILLVDTNCSISAVLKPNDIATEDPAKPASRDEGIAQGIGNLENGQPRIKISYLPKNSEVAVGQIVVSSGRGPYFPAGLPIGTVLEVPSSVPKYPTFGLYREAVLEPAADLNQLNELFVVLGTKDAKKEKPEETSAN